MDAPKKMMSPQEFLQELRQIKEGIKSGDLTKEDQEGLLQDVEEMRELLLELKNELLSKGLISTQFIK
ncbi:MAG: hypothetical protein H6577_20275 [Lewinellaceae bacterium]|nr:hypothetical protein [Saprospiraceae bacterium]MCB9340467.1 hypothetical protein [Lewinellaceae bacterium]